MEEEPQFANLEESVKYWKKHALEYKRKYVESKDELEEFQVNSRELEAELEAQLEQSETQNKELRILSCRVQNDCDNLRDRLEKTQNETNRTVSDLQKDLLHHKTQRDSLAKYVRDLEQTNDDLERAKRPSKEMHFWKMNWMKKRLWPSRYELQIRHQPTPPAKMPDNDLLRDQVAGPVDSNKLTTESETQTAPGSPLRCPNNQICSANSPLTPSARISALNIVGDLLRKVGALESKLASCKNFVKDTPRSRRAHRGISASSHGRNVLLHLVL
uniref:NUDE domain-containing protein n=1 Tax=Strigamia maritima TaxID=126957 RepID=T1JIJ9_STRMM